MTHSKAPWLTRGSAIALMMAAGIALAACGGGGGLNEDEAAGLKQQLDEAQTQAAAALAAQQVEEAARIAAEAAQATAEAEKATAEAEKAVADAAREVAVADAAAAEMAKATAEAETATAEAARELAVAAREVAVAEAAAAETDRLAAEAETATADAARELAVAAKKTAEADAAAARAATKTAEDDAAAARTAQQAAETARDAAEAAQTLAEENADEQVALAETAKMEARDAADAVEQAEAALIVAQDMQKAAEDERDAAVTAEATARQQLQTALAATTAEERRRQAAEAEQDRLAQVAEDARQQVSQADAREVLKGLGGLDAPSATIIGTAGEANDPEVTVRYRAAASVTTPLATFALANATTGSLSGWFKTSYSVRGGVNADRLDVYSNVEQPKSISFRDSDYNDGTQAVSGEINTATTVVAPSGSGTTPSEVINSEGMVVGWLDITPNDNPGNRDDAASSAFPRDGSAGAMSYTLTDRGITEAQFGALGNVVDGNTVVVADEVDDSQLAGLSITRQELVQYIRGRSFRDEERYPDRYEYERSGTLQNASGTYRCAGNNVNEQAPDCSVQKRGGHFHFVGPWTFRPSSSTSKVQIGDENYMYFGLWSRQAISSEAWSFRTFHGPEESRDDSVSDVTGTATYQGPAVGYYAIYQPLGAQSGHGDFSATASLTADFDADEVHGTIDQFSGHSDWSLTLKNGEISGGDAGNNGMVPGDLGGVSWSIGGRATEGGLWSANFYSNLPEGERTGVPSGIAGTFEAEYSDTTGADIGRIMGAFGAECRTGC